MASKKRKGKGKKFIFTHTKKYNWQMQREDLMFSQYIVWYERNYARTMVEIMYNIKLILDNTYYIFEFICQNFSKTLSYRPDKKLDEFMISFQIWTPNINILLSQTT